MAGTILLASTILLPSNELEGVLGAAPALRRPSGRAYAGRAYNGHRPGLLNGFPPGGPLMFFPPLMSVAFQSARGGH